MAFKKLHSVAQTTPKNRQVLPEWAKNLNDLFDLGWEVTADGNAYLIVKNSIVKYRFRVNSSNNLVVEQDVSGTWTAVLTVNSLV